jgi:acyl carrier protein
MSEHGQQTKDEVLDAVRACIREVIGEAWADEVSIERETSFSEDLELESIELVALSEKLAERFGAGVDFVGWLSEMELDAILALTVGDVVEQIERCR